MITEKDFILAIDSLTNNPELSEYKINYFCDAITTYLEKNKNNCNFIKSFPDNALIGVLYSFADQQTKLPDGVCSFITKQMYSNNKTLVIAASSCIINCYKKGKELASDVLSDKPKHAAIIEGVIKRYSR